jgi:hypothetical protein
MSALEKTQKEIILLFIPKFIEFLNSKEHQEIIEERSGKLSLINSILSKENISEMTELEFGQVISSLWASQMWGNKGYLVEKIIAENGFEKIKSNLFDLLWGPKKISDRYDDFRRNIRGFGAGMITEILLFLFPAQYGVWNIKARQALSILGFKDSFPAIKNSQINGKEYDKFNELLVSIRYEMKNGGAGEVDNFGVNSFFYNLRDTGTPSPTPIPPDGLVDFDHDELIDQIYEIGQWLGFEVHKEKLVAPGAKVDVIWQAKISTLGVVTYVFEVQRRGSIDSLILNLQKAQNNPSVQKLIIVALPGEIQKISNEVKALPEVFRKLVSYMDVNEIIKARDLANELQGIINKMELVKSEFVVENN